MKLLPKHSPITFGLYGARQTYFETLTEKDAIIENYGAMWIGHGYDSFIYVNDTRNKFIIHFRMKDLV